MHLIHVLEYKVSEIQPPPQMQTSNSADAHRVHFLYDKFPTMCILRWVPRSLRPGTGYVVIGNYGEGCDLVIHACIV